MLRIQKQRLTAILYDNLFEPGTFATSSKNIDQKNRELYPTQYNYDQEHWLGASSIEEVNQRLKLGWSTGVDKLQELAIKEINPQSLKRRKIRADQGDELDIHAVYRGDLSRAWTKTKKMNVNGVRNKNVTLFCNLTCMGKTHSSELFFRGASILKITEALTEVGYNVSIYGFDSNVNCGVDSSYRKSFDIVQFVEIKSLDSPLDLSNLASLVCMPAYKRMYFHTGIVEESDRRNLKIRSGLGQIAHGEENIKASIEMLGCFADFQFIQPMVNNKSEAEAWIDNVMNQIEGQ